MKQFFNVNFLLRLPVGMSFLGHGLIRLPKLQAFANGMVEQFASSWMPDSLVLAFGYILPIVELIIGIMIIFSLWYREALVGGILTVTALIFGSSMIENWGALVPQLIHAIYFGLLLVWFDKERLQPKSKSLEG